MAERAAKYPTAQAFMPARITLQTLREAASGCKGCDLYKCGTQTVFGEGRKDSKVMFVGEQPGDQEDRAGKPFVGPAGALLDRVLEEVGIDRKEVYVTNAVKHFKFEQRGKRRIHSKPNAREVTACKPWFVAEVEVIKPEVIVALGATAAQAMLGKDFRVTQSRGKPIHDSTWGPCVIATVHPSSILRAPDEAARREAMEDFTRDLRVVKKEMERIERSGERRAPQHSRRVPETHPGALIREREQKKSRLARARRHEPSLFD